MSDVAACSGHGASSAAVSAANPSTRGAIVVTGASGGIGAACALLLAERGTDLALADLAPPEQTAARARSHGSRVVSVVCDVTDESSCARLAETAIGSFGAVNGAVLAAGSAHHAAMLELTPRQWRELVDLHLTGTFLSLQALARVMTGGGSIVCLSSTVATAGGPPRQAHYVAAKAGTLGLVRAAARELGPRGVIVNSVSPGFTETPMNEGLFSEEERASRAARAPLGRTAVPSNVAGVVAFLLSPDADFVTGQDIRVDGGASLS